MLWHQAGMKGRGCDGNTVIVVILVLEIQEFLSLGALFSCKEMLGRHGDYFTLH